MQDDKIVELSGIEFQIIDLPSLSPGGPQKHLFPVLPSGPKDRFLADGPFSGSDWAASKGISAHVLDVVERERPIPNLPRNVNEHGFSAAHLSILGDDRFFAECWEVLIECGWASNFGEVSQDTLANVQKHDGDEIVDLSKKAFGENWVCYILERASIYQTEPFARPWYASNILSAYYARQDDILFGFLWAEYRLKLRVQKVANTGGKVISATKKAAEQTTAKYSQLRERRFARMAALVPEIGVDKAAAQCAAEGLGSWQAIKRQWNRFQKKRDR